MANELPDNIDPTVLYGKKAGTSLFSIQYKPDGMETFLLTPTFPTKEDAAGFILSDLKEREEEKNRESPDFNKMIAGLGLKEHHVPGFIDALVNHTFEIDTERAMRLGLRAKASADMEAGDKRKEPRAWYHDPKTGDRTRITEAQKAEYIAKGWKPGRDVDASPELKWYHRPVANMKGYVERERITLAQVPAYVDNGYYLGKGSGKTWHADMTKAKDAEGTAESEHNPEVDGDKSETPDNPEVGNMDPEPAAPEETKEEVTA